MAISHSANSTPLLQFQTLMARETQSNYNNAVRYIAPFVVGVIFTIGLLGNLCFIAIVRRQNSSQLQPPRRPVVQPLILQSMAFADLLLLLFVCPLSALEFAQETWSLGDQLCQIVRPVEFVVQMVTAFNLSILSIDACLVAAFPRGYDSWKTGKNAILGCVLIWMLSIMFALPLWSNSGTVESLDGRLFCTIKWPDAYPLSCPLYITVFGFITPIVLTVISLLWIVIHSKTYWWHPSAPKTTTPPGSASKYGLHRSLRLITHLTFALLVCWLPYNIVPFFVPLYSSSSNPTNVDTRLYTTIACYAYAFSCVKPLLYIFHQPDIRSGFVDCVPYRGPTSRPSSNADIHGIRRSFYRDRVIGTGVLCRTNTRGPDGSVAWSIHGFPGSIISAGIGDDHVSSSKDRRLTV